jgi:putative protease
MTILSPCDRVDELAPLVEAGAGELYGGAQPDGWAGRFVSANQRTFASAHFPSETALGEALFEARRLGAPFHLTLNAPLYDPASYGELLGLAERAAARGAAGLIVGDLGLLVRLHKARLPLEVTLSTLAGATNREALRFFARFGIARAVLPRHLTLAEMGNLVRAHPGIGFEAFVLVGRCPNEEAYCTFQHVSPDKRWPCEIPYRLSDTDGLPLGPEHPLARWHDRWSEADRRLACGLCAIGPLRKAGVHCLKLVGRGGPTEAKIANVRLVAEFLSRRRHLRRDARQAYVGRFGRPCHPLTCYFPELHPDRSRTS